MELNELLCFYPEYCLCQRVKPVGAPGSPFTNEKDFMDALVVCPLNVRMRCVKVPRSRVQRRMQGGLRVARRKVDGDPCRMTDALAHGELESYDLVIALPLSGAPPGHDPRDEGKADRGCGSVRCARARRGRLFEDVLAR